MAMMNLPRVRSSARSIHAHCRSSTVRRTPLSIASSAKSSVCNSKNGARWVPTSTPYCRRRRAASAISLSMRRALVLVSPRSASTRASIAARAAFGLEEVCVKPFQRIVPVVVAGDRIDRLGEALEGKIKIGFVIMHRSRGIDHVGGHDEKLHVIASPQFQIARDQ